MHLVDERPKLALRPSFPSIGRDPNTKHLLKPSHILMLDRATVKQRNILKTNCSERWDTLLPDVGKTCRRGFRKICSRLLSLSKGKLSGSNLQSICMASASIRSIPRSRERCLSRTASAVRFLCNLSLPRSGVLPVRWFQLLSPSGSVRRCVRRSGAVHMTASHNALRGSGPGQKLAFENAVALMGLEPDEQRGRPNANAVGASHVVGGY